MDGGTQYGSRPCAPSSYGRLTPHERLEIALAALRERRLQGALGRQTGEVRYPGRAPADGTWGGWELDR